MSGEGYNFDQQMHVFQEHPASGGRGMIVAICSNYRWLGSSVGVCPLILVEMGIVIAQSSMCICMLIFNSHDSNKWLC